MWPLVFQVGGGGGRWEDRQEKMADSDNVSLSRRSVHTSSQLTRCFWLESEDDERERKGKERRESKEERERERESDGETKVHKVLKRVNLSNLKTKKKKISTQHTRVKSHKWRGPFVHTGSIGGTKSSFQQCSSPDQHLVQQRGNERKCTEEKRHSKTPSPPSLPPPLPRPHIQMLSFYIQIPGR